MDRGTGATDKAPKPRRSMRQRVTFALFVYAIAFFAYLYGYSSVHQGLFPAPWIDAGIRNVSLVMSALGARPWYQTRNDRARPVTPSPSDDDGRLTLVSLIDAKRHSVVRVIDRQNAVVFSWDTDWFRTWPDADHVTEEELPKTHPGTQVHGMALMANGDLVFNFEFLGLMRLDPCGNVVWRLPYRTHHSIHVDEDGHLWVPGQRRHFAPDPDYPNHVPPFFEPVLLEVTPDGTIRTEISVFDLLRRNGLEGLLFMSTIENSDTAVSGDTLHLNDVEPYPRSWPAGVFGPGDVMISLRNINTVLVFRKSDLKVKWIKTGDFIRQHDPDFLDGNRILLFDNGNTLTPSGRHSRIRVIDAKTGTITTRYPPAGKKAARFFTWIMGKQQRLAHGGLLITDAMQGRVFEVDRSGRIVWQYVNQIEDGWVSVVSGAQRLPPRYDRQFFARLAERCKTAQHAPSLVKRE